MDIAAINGKRFAIWLTDDSDESALFGGEVRSSLLDSDYYLRLWIGKLPDAPDEAEYEKTDLRPE